jgi:hypothetical protein
MGGRSDLDSSVFCLIIPEIDLSPSQSYCNVGLIFTLDNINSCKLVDKNVLKIIIK